MIAALLFAVLGCTGVTEPAPTAIRAYVQSAIATPGYAVPVHLVNSSANDWTVAPCPLALQRLDADGWRSTRLPPCNAAAFVHSGGEPYVTEVLIPWGSEYGTYRLVYSSWPVVPGQSLVAIEQVRVYSNQFEVPAFR